MVGQVPQSRPPAYADQFGQVMTNAAQSRADVLKSELESNSTNLGHILGNITKIAEVGGGQFTPDRLLAAYAGSQGDILDDQYSGMADRLRLAEQQAKIGALSRSGRGGGSKGPKPFELGSDEMVINFRGQRMVVKGTNADDIRKQLRVSYGASDEDLAGMEVLQVGPRLTPDGRLIHDTGIEKIGGTPTTEIDENAINDFLINAGDPPD